MYLQVWIPLRFIYRIRKSESSIAVHIPKNNLDFEIENSMQALKALLSKLKKLYKKEINSVVWVFESTRSTHL